ncbi:uncharacterized protein SCHCODRAFT_02593040 [Schizophyllum commune H4-8]|nr:uncharacterized protein SCHCODRAFT_02593040 [Schizophyllum commune H4-8]KAI5886196.1 hypothetical protein SCHCODRAFT_02593040 [Schizophyllum commune H4-8]
MQPPNSRAAHVNSPSGSTAASKATLGWPGSAAMLNNSGIRYNTYTGDSDGVHHQDRPSPQETSFGVIDRPWSQPAREFQPCRHGFDRSSVTQDNRLIGVSPLALAQRYLQHDLLHPVSATGQLDDIIPFGHDQNNETTIRPEDVQYDPAFARAPEHASITAYNTPLRLEARFPITDTDTPAPWNPHHAAASMYHEPLQALRCEDHCAARPTQQVIEFAGKTTSGADFGDRTLDYSTSVSSEFPFACATCPMPFEAKSSYNEFATQLPAPQLPCTRPEPAAASQSCIDLGTPMRSLNFAT